MVNIRKFEEEILNREQNIFDSNFEKLNVNGLNIGIVFGEGKDAHEFTFFWDSREPEVYRLHWVLDQESRELDKKELGDVELSLDDLLEFAKEADSAGSYYINVDYYINVNDFKR